MTFLRPPKTRPSFPRRNSTGTPRLLLQLEKNHESLPSTRDKALFCCCVSREIPPSVLSLESFLDSLEATQEVPRHSHLHSRGTPRILTQHKKSPGFPSSSQEEGLFRCFVGKEIPAFSSQLKRRRSQLDTREELQGSYHDFKSPRCPSALHIHLTPLQLTWRSPRGETNNIIAGVTALWHLEKKPRIPMSTRQEA